MDLGVLVVFEMNIVNNNTQINFRAKFKNPVQILKKDISDHYVPHNAAFVELEPDNANDIKALANINRYWAERDQYVCNIYTTAIELRRNKDLNIFTRIFAVTEQNDNFEKLNDEKILGLAEVSTRKPKEYYISYIQVDPRNVFSISPEFKRVGTRILDSVKAFANKILLSPNSHDTAKFYEENGFKPSKFSRSIYEWIRE